jgi:predicted enzyme related to lactoylglutathione lyase
MNEGAKTIIFPVTDVGKAKAMFTALLGVEPYADQPYYVGFQAGGQDIGLDPNGHRSGMTGPVVYWHVDDIAGSLKVLVDAGATVKQDVKDVGGGKLIAVLTDADGNPVGLLQAP